MATLIWTDGKPYDVPDDKLQQAVADGFRQPSQEESARIAAGDQTGRAFVEGAVRGATFNFAEPLIVNVGSELDKTSVEASRKAVKLRKEENPIASAAGEIAGGIGMSALTSGGVSALVGHGVRGAVLEGGLYGLGSTISEANLEDRELKAENMAAGLAGGALTGGALAGTFKALGKGVSMGTKALGGSTLGDVLTKAGREVEWRTLAQKNRKLARINDGLKDDIVDLGRKIGVMALDENAVAKAEAAREAIGQQIGANIDDLQRLAPLDDKMRKALVTAVENKLDDAYANSPVYKSAVESAKRQAQTMLESTDATWKDVWKWQSDIYKTLPADPNAVPAASKEALAVVRQTIRNHVIDDVSNTINPGAGSALRKLGREYKVAASLEDMLENRVNSLESSAGLFDLGGAQALVSGALGTAASGGNLLVGAGTAIATRQLERRGGFIAGRVLESLGSGTALKSATQLQQRISTVLAASPAILGKFAIPLMNAGARGAEDLLAEHASIASGPDGDAYLAALGMSKESPEEVKAAGERLAVYDAIDAHAKENAEAMRRAVDGFFGARPGPAPVVVAPPREDFEARLQAIKSVLVNHQGVFEAIPPEFLGMAPETAGLTGQKLLGAAQFLLDKAPRSPWEDKPVALQQPWKPSDADTARWYRYVEAVEEPMKAVERLRDGSASPEHLEALKAVYPQTFAQLQQAMSEKLMLWKEPLPWDKRQTLSQVLGPQVFATPQQVSILQQVHAKNRQGQQGAGGGGSKPDGRQEVNATKNQATQAQKLEAR